MFAMLAVDLDPGILDPSHTAKVGLQATLISNHTHPAQVVLGKGSILEPRIHATATITLTVVSLGTPHGQQWEGRGFIFFLILSGDGLFLCYFKCFGLAVSEIMVKITGGLAVMILSRMVTE